jgi:NitT/TauT family transport system substrate-binding protein
MNAHRPGRIVPLLLVSALAGCRAEKRVETIPSFSLAWSEYPSWSTFGVAEELGLLDGDQGKLGTIEQRWHVDVVLQELEYDPCITGYASGAVDAVCITNMDVLNPSLGRPSVAIMPTSTSKGADACIAVGIADAKGLAGKTVHGLEKSVSEYCFARCLEQLGVDRKSVTFSNMDPGAAATAMRQKQQGIDAIMVWNPFVLDTLRARPEAKVLFDSSSIPGEIVDMVVVAKDSLEKPGGDSFACAVADTFYTIAKRIDDPATRDETLVALGQKFSDLDLESMKKVVVQTDFYETPELGMALFQGKEFPEVMKRVVDFCVSQGITDKPASYAFGTSGAVALRFDPTYMERAASRR